MPASVSQPTCWALGTIMRERPESLPHAQLCPIQLLCSHRGSGDRRGSFRPHLCSSLHLTSVTPRKRTHRAVWHWARSHATRLRGFCLFLRQICRRSRPSFGFSVLLRSSYSVLSKLQVWPAGSVCLAFRVKKGPWDPVALEPGTVHLEHAGLWGLRESKPCFAPC